MERQLYQPERTIDCSQFEFDCPYGELNKRSSSALLNGFCFQWQLLVQVHTRHLGDNKHRERNLVTDFLSLSV